MTYRIHWALAMIVPLLIAGCATISFSTRQNVHLASAPPSANYTMVKIVNGIEQEVASGLTPDTISIKRGEGYFEDIDYRLSVTLAGYETVKIPLHSNLTVGAIVFDFMLGLIPLLVIDPLTGAIYYYTAPSSNTDVASVNTDLVNRRNLNISIVFRTVSAENGEGLVKIAQATEKR